MRVASVAVIGRANNPLAVQRFIDPAGGGGGGDGSGGGASLKLHYFSHIAIDVIDERLAQQPARRGAAGGHGAASADGYLGQLFVVEDFRAYGFCSNTRVKVVVVLKGSAVGDGVAKALLRDAYELYTEAAANPFRAVDDGEVKSARFAQRLEAVVRHYERKAG